MVGELHDTTAMYPWFNESAPLFAASYPVLRAESSRKPGEYPGETSSYPIDDDRGSDPRQGVPARPLRAICVGPGFQIGGVEQHTLSLARFLDPDRVRLVKCLVTNPDGFHGPTAERMPFPVVPCSPADLASEVSDCDLLLMWGEGFNGRLPEKRPIGVYLAHGESPWTRLGLEQSSNVVDHVIAVSDRVKERVCHGFPTTTILNGVDTARLGQTCSPQSVRERLNFAPGDFIVGSVCRFTGEKQMPLLIDAVARLPQSFKLLLVGYGPRRAELLDQANERIPGRFAFVKADNYLGDFYRAMDAFCLVSSHEGFGLVIPEAMLCNRPVIATCVGCVPEVIRDRISGVVVDPTPESIADAMRMLQAHPNWARGIAAEGHAFADAHLHARRMARDYEDLFWRLAADRPNQ
jgi:glycosyltransferase involved in cell wall biosynthesis